ncbi:MAG: putative Ig domain-containing protein, partial [Synergistaceae bacterium]|nr:putative Ig domain-containing protein [Synergistaceae bacterium]
ILTVCAAVFSLLLCSSAYTADLAITVVQDFVNKKEGETYGYLDGRLHAECDHGRISWSVVEGALPDGLSLKESAVSYCHLSGTAKKAGTYTFTVMLTDEEATRTATKTFTITITPNANHKTPYSESISVAGEDGGGEDSDSGGGSGDNTNNNSNKNKNNNTTSNDQSGNTGSSSGGGCNSLPTLAIILATAFTFRKSRT